MSTPELIAIVSVVTLMSGCALWVFESAMVPYSGRLPNAIWFYRCAWLLVIAWVTASSAFAQLQPPRPIESQIERNAATIESLDGRLDAIEQINVGPKIAVLEQSRIDTEKSLDTLSDQFWGIILGLALVIGGQVAQIRFTARNGDGPRKRGHE